MDAQPQPGRYGKDPGFAFALQEGSGEAGEPLGRIPGPPIVLTRGQPVEITVLNKLSEPTSVHWHAMELESYYDGIAGWSGTAGHLAPMIQPALPLLLDLRHPARERSFITRTWMIFASSAQDCMVRSSCLSPVKSLDPDRDRIMLVSVKGPSDNTPILLNGEADPAPIELKSGIDCGLSTSRRTIPL